MAFMPDSSLRALAETPFELLSELERRGRAAVAGTSVENADGEEFTGIAFRLGEDCFMVIRDEVREVLMVPEDPTRVPGAKDWITGLANVRGQLLPIIDLRSFVGASTSRLGRRARVLVLNSADVAVGVIVDEVFGFRRFLDNEFTSDCPETVANCGGFLAGAYRRDDEIWPLFSMTALLDSEEFRQPSAV